MRCWQSRRWHARSRLVLRLSLRGRDVAEHSCAFVVTAAHPDPRLDRRPSYANARPPSVFFSSLLEETPAAGALTFAQRVVKGVAAEPLHAGGRRLPITCSAGSPSSFPVNRAGMIRWHARTALSTWPRVRDATTRSPRPRPGTSASGSTIRRSAERRERSPTLERYTSRPGGGPGFRHSQGVRLRHVAWRP